MRLLIKNINGKKYIVGVVDHAGVKHDEEIQVDEENIEKLLSNFELDTNELGSNVRMFPVE